MDQEQQQRFRSIIRQRLEAITAGLEAGAEATEPIAPDAAIGRLSRLDSMQMQQIALAGQRRLKEERARLQEAQRRIDAGTYGRCPLCGDDIAGERLEYQPDAVTCVPCLQRKK